MKVVSVEFIHIQRYFNAVCNSEEEKITFSLIFWAQWDSKEKV
jgi:hypothetical protein